MLQWGSCWAPVLMYLLWWPRPAYMQHSFSPHSEPKVVDRLLHLQFVLLAYTNRRSAPVLVDMHNHKQQSLPLLRLRLNLFRPESSSVTFFNCSWQCDCIQACECAIHLPYMHAAVITLCTTLQGALLVHSLIAWSHKCMQLYHSICRDVVIALLHHNIWDALSCC